MPKLTGKTIAVIGGGRWARVLVGVLADMLPSGSEILWVTQHNAAAANQWRDKAQPAVPVRVMPELNGFSGVDAAVVATATRSHAEVAYPLLEHGVPTLIEKPFACDADEADRLCGLAERCVAGVNFEFMYADFLHGFREAVADVPIHDIAITWHDPAIEIRQGETKLADNTVSVMHDFLPHCWSLLHMLCSDETFDTVSAVDYYSATGAAELSGALTDGTPVRLSLSRHGEKRRREIALNGGTCLLDFSQEPGHRVIQGQYSPNPQTAQRPLGRTLQDFLTVADDPTHYAAWPLALRRCRPSIDLAIRAEALLQASFRQQLESLRRIHGLDADDPACNRLLLDMFAPVSAAREAGFQLRTPEQQRSFTRHILTTLASDTNGQGRYS